MEDEKKTMALLIAKYLKSELNSGQLSDETFGSIDIAMQCISSAYELKPSEIKNCNLNLENIVKEHYNIQCDDRLRKQNNNFKYSLDTKYMLIPTQVDEYKYFWKQFVNDIKEFKQLKVINLNNCPAYVIEDSIKYLPQLEVLKATSVKNVYLQNQTHHEDFKIMILNLSLLSQLINLTEIRINGLSEIEITDMSSFANLLNLKTLSLTSIKQFPQDIYTSLTTVTAGLEHLEIGDCYNFDQNFAFSLRRFIRLKSLRLENVYDEWEDISEDIFGVINNLPKLKMLELVNFKLSTNMLEKLEKCYRIKALLIIPTDYNEKTIFNQSQVNSLKKLSKSLTHLLWGLDENLLPILESSVHLHQLNINNINNSSSFLHNYLLDNDDKSKCEDVSEDVAVNKTKNVIYNGPNQITRWEISAESTNEKDASSNLPLINSFQLFLQEIMKDIKVKVITVPSTKTTRVYLDNQFNDLIF